METRELIEGLSVPSAYPEPAESVEVHQTHISIVFLAGALAYKIKKPVDLGFLDYTTLERRRHFCEEEVRLNRRLAPSVYLGVVPVTRVGDRLRVEGDGSVVEWAVKMERLPDCGDSRVPPRARGGRGRRDRRPGPPAGRVPRPCRSRTEDCSGRFIRGGCPECAGKLPAVGGARREHAQPRDPRTTEIPD